MLGSGILNLMKHEGRRPQKKLTYRFLKLIEKILADIEP